MNNQISIPDIDIDVKDRDECLTLISEYTTIHTASQLDNKNGLVKHNTGVYIQNIPTDPLTGVASFPYDTAEALGYYKLDLIPYHIYSGVVDEDHLKLLLAIAEDEDNFPWEMFLEERFYNNEIYELQITQLAKHYTLCKKYPPKSVIDLAILNALIRPRKRHLIGKPFDEIRELVWQKIDGEQGYFFKKSHAVAFALAIIVHIQILNDKV